MNHVDQIFYLMMEIGSILLLITILITPFGGRPMIREARMKHDRRMKRATKFLIPAGILITFGFVGQFLQ